LEIVLKQAAKNTNKYFDLLIHLQSINLALKTKYMKKILLTALSLFTVVLLQASNLELYFGGNMVPHGSTIQVMGDPSDDYIQARVSVKNIGSAAIDVKTKKLINAGDTLPGTLNYFCWGLCFPPFTYISPNSLNIAPGVTNEEFYGDYNANNIPGKSKITYVFFDMNNVNDSVAITVEFNASPASVIDPSEGVKFSEAYPNPATDVVNVDYTLTSRISEAGIVISNMLGCRVKEIALTENSGKIRIPVNELTNGIYFYSLVGNDQVILTRKFVVKR
jgi:hypothetical protein